MDKITIIDFLRKVDKVILNPIIYLLFALSTLIFLYGIVKFLSVEPGDKARIDARNSMLWGIIGIIIMFSVYGLINFMLGTFGLTSTDITSPDAKTILRLN